MIWYLLIASPIAGIAGRLGGCGKQGKWYDFLAWSKTRDIICALLITLGVALYLGFSWSLAWLYLAVFSLHYLSLLTYWDWLFNGEDNLCFSGFMVGCAALPVLFVAPELWWILTIRVLLLSTWWHCLNKYLPNKFWVWRRDVAEEFLRYAALV